MTECQTITPREKLDFGLDGDIPKYWFDGNPFKTRLCDAMSSIFPEGERFFMCCVGDFRERVTDPQLLSEIRSFMRQESQHGIVHAQYNERLKRQGIAVNVLAKISRYFLFRLERKYLSARQTLAETAAAEHLTAIMAHGYFEHRKLLATADRRMRAMYAWHAMEEYEHKSVAFDVMQKVARVGYFQRVFALLFVTFSFNIYCLLTVNYMLKVDGLRGWKRFVTMLEGMGWMFRPGGLYMGMARQYFQYFKPGFHPREQGQMQCYQIWLATFDRTGDPVEAGDALHDAT